jgi:indole-3-glycerol phosphate synthase
MADVHPMLRGILDATRAAVEIRRRRIPLPALRQVVESGCRVRRDFAGALRRPGRLAVIAECKRASPSAGTFRDHYDPAAIAREYQRLGAAAVSVLTEERHFGGSLEHLADVRAAVSLPVLRKDFVIDIYQLYEAAAVGADAVLLIGSLLDDGMLRDLSAAADELGLAALIEVHTAQDIERAMLLNARIVGINNRDLNDFTVDVSRAIRLRALIPPEVIAVAESGIDDGARFAAVRAAGFDAVLIGTHFMRAESIAGAFEELMAPVVGNDG